MVKPVDIVNQALAAIGHPRPISDFWEGSPGALAAIEVYGQTRDELLRAGNWAFARTTQPLVLSMEVPPYPWQAAYNYPSDCIFFREILLSTQDLLDPVLNPWTVAEVIGGRAILANFAPALGVYTQKVTDPTFWDPLFIASLVASLSKKFLRRPLVEMDQSTVAMVKPLTDEIERDAAVGVARQG